MIYKFVISYKRLSFSPGVFLSTHFLANKSILQQTTKNFLKVANLYLIVVCTIWSRKWRLADWTHVCTGMCGHSPDLGLGPEGPSWLAHQSISRLSSQTHLGWSPSPVGELLKFPRLHRQQETELWSGERHSGRWAVLLSGHLSLERQ